MLVSSPDPLEEGLGTRLVICQLESDGGPITLCTRFGVLCESDFLIYDHMTTGQHKKLYRQSLKTDHAGLPKVVFYSVAISKQLNIAPYLRGVHKAFPQPQV